MPPKAQFDKERIAQEAMAIAREQGLSQLTARALAQRLGCSTSPIYTAFQTMQELEDLVCERSASLMLEYQTRPYTGSPLEDMCLGYVLFAVDERQLFCDMFLNKPELSEHSRATRDQALESLLRRVLSREPALAGLGRAKKLQLLETLWTYAHGLAAQLCVGALAVPDQAGILARLRLVIAPLLAGLRP